MEILQFFGNKRFCLLTFLCISFRFQIWGSASKITLASNRWIHSGKCFMDRSNKPRIIAWPVHDHGTVHTRLAGGGLGFMMFWMIISCPVLGNILLDITVGSIPFRKKMFCWRMFDTSGARDNPCYAHLFLKTSLSAIVAAIFVCSSVLLWNSLEKLTKKMTDYPFSQ